MARNVTPAKLRTYAAKRDFGSTPEPPPGEAKVKTKVKVKGGSRQATTLSFCVQKHLASALHYDFRLEHDGVLLSWAVPKGPSLNPADKRMAVRTEDHPLAYGDFEGVIPGGYGAGVVMLWDRGTWESETPDVAAGLAKGELKLRLDGVKLKGSWVLVRTRRKMGDREAWLLIKHRDQWAGEIDVTSAAPDSVKSFGDFPAIVAADKERAAITKHAAASNGKGEAATLLRQVVAEAAERAAGKMPKKAETSKAPGAAKSASAAKTAKASVPSKPTKRAKPRSVAAPLPAPKASTPAPAEPKFTNRDKVLFPATGFTKGDLIDYYRRAAPLILPHLAGRAVTLKRYPDGVDGKSFFEKRCPSHRPPWVKTATVELTDKTIDFCVIADLPTLLWTANLATIELHAPLTRAESPDTPTTMVFDLDPGPPATIADCVPVALRLRELLAGVGLQCLLKTSGSKGLHLVVPLNTLDVTFDQTKAFARATALTLQRDDPKRVIASMARAERPGKVFIDWSQNDRNKTTVCVYSVRAREEPFVSTPVDWKQLERGRVPEVVSAEDVRATADRFAAAIELEQRLPM